MNSQEVADAGRALRVAIAASGLKQWQVAKRARIGRFRFNRIVNGHVEAEPRERGRIAGVLSRALRRAVTVDELFPSTSAPAATRAAELVTSV